jgi:DEAD/DEAH box helicase domain-containing protein
MNFKQFYNNTEQRIIDTILSLWATGDAEMQIYLREIFKDEAILAKPVFQNMFPWEPSNQSFGDLNSIFNNEFIQKLDNINNPEYRFPIDRKPYLHQVKSWESSLIDKKSILVTTGTGSGKTECFMLPVLYDIFKHRPNETGINAIFLYPLNALIGSQKKRMHEWCKSLGNIKYAVYNGNTKNSVPKNTESEKYPEIISREGIRNNPPQVLFTNPTMLEYMLVRDKDTELLNNSQGKLRWILLDEAHTLTGSKAAEMALLIRRVVDAFGVNVNDVRFAVTSATVGSGNDDSLKQFMSDLCGINTSQIEVITGKKILPAFDRNILTQNQIEESISINFRNKLFQSSCVDEKDISDTTGIKSISEQLSFIDKLADLKDNGQPILPVRGHFFVRNINGLYACTNPTCKVYHNMPNQVIGSLTSITKKNCSCGYPLLELVSCRTCGSFMMEGEKFSNIVQQNSKQNNDFFQVDEIEDEEENDINSNSKKERFILAKQIPNRTFTTPDNLIPVSINKDGSLAYDTKGPLFEVMMEENEQCRCPYCSNRLNNPFHFRLSASFLNRLMSDIILEQTNDAYPITKEMLWSGKKYISFTDSRQGTAKISALINIDSENYWLRSQIYHSLCLKRNQQIPSTLTNEQRIKIEVEIAYYRKESNNNQLPPFVIEDFKNKIEKNLLILNPSLPLVKDSRITWNEILQSPSIQGTDFQNLFHHNVGGNVITQGIDYLKALLYNEFSRRLPRERSMENLGMVNLVYPALDNILAPKIAIDLGIENEDWKSLVKIALDYVIRYKFFYNISPNVRGLASTRHKTFQIYPVDTKTTDVQKWPKFDRNNIRPNRLVLLICAGLNYHSPSEIDNDKEDQINNLLEQLWTTIRSKFLTADGPEGGFKLNLETTTAFELADKLWLCPVKKRLIDTNFKGYSPWINGRLDPTNINAFIVSNPIVFPLFPFAFNRNQSNEYDQKSTINWFNDDADVKSLKNKGLWTSLHERIINFKPLYLTGEHSAQQSKERLDKLEQKFQDGTVNILSCSTTMEMGVDIGGISAVVMSNVPPSPANYLQRTGRAGRRGENKSLAFTICAANPIGANVIDNPKWALEHKIAPPMLAFSSKAVVHRHLNAFFLGKFVQIELKGIAIQEKLENFFINNLPGQDNTGSQRFLNWLLSFDVNNFADAIKEIIKNTPFKNYSPSVIIQNVYTNFEVITTAIDNNIKNFDEALKRFVESEKYTESSPAYKAVKFQKNQFLHKNLLAYLSEEGFLPAGGIPTGVVEFNNTYKEDISRDNQNIKQLPSFHITRALSEYAPNMEIVIDGWAYKSAGISLKNNWGVNATKNILQHCTNCGAEHIVSQSGTSISKICAVCNKDSLSGIIPSTGYTEIIEPAGFAVDLFGEKSREIKESSNTQYVEPLLIGVEPWSDSSHPVFEYRDSKENAEILYYNHGVGSGYSVCLDCGRASSNANDLRVHKRLRGGRDKENISICKGNENSFAIRENVLLVGRFQTDFFELRCKGENGKLINDETTLYSVGQVISKSLTSFLGVEEQEVNFGIKRYSGFGSIFLFDTAKGGAGYVSQLTNFFEEVCKEALEKLKNCNCTSSCTKCLIDRNSQYHIDKLNRHNAIDWLKRVIDTKVSEEISVLLPNNPKKLIGSVKDDWVRLFGKKQLGEVWLMVDSQNIESWEIDNFMLLIKMKMEDCPINIVFKGLPIELGFENKLTLNQIKTFANFYYTDSFAVTNGNGLELNLIGKAKLIDGQIIEYYGEAFSTEINNNWGSVMNNFVYKQNAISLWHLHQYNIDFESMHSNVFEVFLTPPTDYISSQGLFNHFFDNLKLNERNRIINNLTNKKVDIVYSDRFLLTPLGCVLLVQFIQKLKETSRINAINSLTISVKKIKNITNLPNYLLTESFSNDYERAIFFKRIAEQFGILKVIIQNDENIPHYRYLKINIEGKKSITIRPDAGIEHGWFVKNKNLKTSDLKGTESLDIQQKLNKNLLYSLVFDDL